MRFHFIGIKGSGMSALAILLKKLGHDVQGSDTSDFIFTQNNLKKEKIKILEYSEKNLKGIDVVIVGHAFINSDNIELITARKKKLKMYEYNKFIAEFIEKYYSIAVSGTHGKTTTTSLIFNVLREHFSAGTLIGDGTAFINKNSKYFVFEACEYQDHFLVYHPNVILVNNIEWDHVDYFKSERAFAKSFYKFIKNAKEQVIINGDDKYLKRLKGNNIVRFGLKKGNDYRAKKITTSKEGISYELYHKKKLITKVELPYFGQHMVYNSLAAFATCSSVDVPVEKIIKGLLKFKGVKKRFAETIINDDVYIDDYAHHPSEIRATIKAVRQKYPGKKIIAFFKGDRYSRIKIFGKKIAKELAKADRAYVLEFASFTKKEANVEIDASYITSFNKKVELLGDNEETYGKLASESNVVYLMMSSKNMLDTIEKIKVYKG